MSKNTKLISGILFTVAVLAGITLTMFSPHPDKTAREAFGEPRQTVRGSHTIAYHVLGDGPRVVLTASLGREASDFNELAQTLAQAGYRAVAVEAPGIGDSTIPQGEYGLFDLADDVKAVVDQDAKDTGEAASVFLGHAFGNRLARATAAKYPEIARGLVLVAAGGKRPIEDKARTALQNCFNPQRTASQRLADVSYAFFADGNDVPDHWRVGWHGDTAQLQIKATSTTPSAQWWHGGGHAPMLVVQASDDVIAPKEDTADLLKEEFGARVEVVMIQDAGHALLPEQPQAIAQAVVGFLDGLEF